MTDLHDLNTRNKAKGATRDIIDRDIKEFWDSNRLNYYSSHRECGCGTLPFVTFWMCWVAGRDVCPTPFDASYAHYDLEEAQIEAERLARLPANKGKTVYLLECIGKCKVDPIPVVWEWPEWPDEP